MKAAFQREKKVDWFFTWQRTYEMMTCAGNLYFGEEVEKDGTKDYILELIRLVINDEPMTWAVYDWFREDTSKYFIHYSHDKKSILMRCFNIEEDFDVIMKKIENALVEYKMYYEISQAIANDQQRDEYDSMFDFKSFTRRLGKAVSDDDRKAYETFRLDENNRRKREEEYIKILMKKVKFSELSNASRAMGLYVWYLSEHEKEQYPTIASAIEGLRVLKIDDKNVLESLGRATYIDSSTLRKCLAQTRKCIDQQKVLPFSS